MANSEKFQVKTIEEFFQQPEEFQTSIRKIVRSHAINELYGSQVFDEPAIALAPTPYAKWLTCRVAMEEYGHHVRFAELGEAIGIPHDDLLPRFGGKRPLSIFDFAMRTWPEFCVLKLLGDLAEILQVEDLIQCSFHPLRNLARMTIPEERFHAQFGEDFCSDLIQEDETREQVQGAIDRIYPLLPAFFGAAKSRNNTIFRNWGIKVRTNEAMREDYMRRARELVDKLGLDLPEVADAAA